MWAGVGNVVALGMADITQLDDPRHQAVLDWELTAPAARQPQTAIALAAQLGVSDRTLRTWKERPDFQAAWRAGFAAVAGSMARTKAILDQLYEDSLDVTNDRRTASAKLHWDISRAIAPPEPEMVSSRRARDLSDSELRQLLSSAALAELVERMDAATRVAAS